jgi:hypothetical protein
MPCTSLSSRKALHEDFSGLIAHGMTSTRNRYLARILPFKFFPHFSTSLRSCNGHAPLLVQERRARAGQHVQSRRDGQYSYLNSSLAHGKKKRSVTHDFNSHSQRLFFSSLCFYLCFVTQSFSAVLAEPLLS